MPPALLTLFGLVRGEVRIACCNRSNPGVRFRIWIAWCVPRAAPPTSTGGAVADGLVGLWMDGSSTFELPDAAAAAAANVAEPTSGLSL